MIRVHRLPVEPPRLATTRLAELERIRKDFPSGPATRDDLGKRFTEVAHELWTQQDAKCCYCELKCRLQGNDVEHYRPASLYWWLAWSWGNLLFACPNCNRWAKNDKFPLQDPSTKLQPEDAPPGTERPHLIDPSAENPMAQIVFTLDPASKHWMAKPRAGSVRGAVSIVLLKLNAPDLIELRDQHIAVEVDPDIGRICTAMAQGDEHQVRERWEDLTSRVLQRTMPFVALSHDAIDQLIPQTDRLGWGLVLPAPA